MLSFVLLLSSGCIFDNDDERVAVRVITIRAPSEAGMWIVALPEYRVAGGQWLPVQRGGQSGFQDDALSLRRGEATGTFMGPLAPGYLEQYRDLWGCFGVARDLVSVSGNLVFSGISAAGIATGEAALNGLTALTPLDLVAAFLREFQSAYDLRILGVDQCLPLGRGDVLTYTVGSPIDADEFRVRYVHLDWPNLAAEQITYGWAIGGDCGYQTPCTRAFADFVAAIRDAVGSGPFWSFGNPQHPEDLNTRWAILTLDRDMEKYNLLFGVNGILTIADPPSGASSTFDALRRKFTKNGNLVQARTGESIEFTLPGTSLHGAVVRGLVVDAAGGLESGISGALVLVDGFGSTTTDSKGSYEIRNVPAGGRTISASAAGFAPASQALTCVDGQTYVVDFRLTHQTEWSVIVEGITPENDSHIDVVASRTYRWTASGSWRPSPWDPWLGPNGARFKEPNRLIVPNVNGMSLIGRIGSSGPWFLMGAQGSITAASSGRLYMAANDYPDCYNDNSGSVTVHVSMDAAP